MQFEHVYLLCIIRNFLFNAWTHESIFLDKPCMQQLSL